MPSTPSSQQVHSSRRTIARLNNQFFGGGTRILVQDAAVFQTQLTKRTAFGTELTMRKYVEYDANNAPGNLYPSVWNVNPEFEMRIYTRLLQGSGEEFNRIAGPSTTPGLLGWCPAGTCEYGYLCGRVADFRTRLRKQRGERVLGVVLRPIATWTARLRLATQPWKRGDAFAHSTKPIAGAAKPKRKPRLANSTSASKKRYRTP